MNWMLLGRIALVASLTVLPAWGAPRGGGGRGPSEDVGRVVHAVYVERLRQDLALSEAQASAVVPLLEAIEMARRDSRRDQRGLRSGLRDALQRGADDAVLEDLLKRIEEAQDREWRTVRDLTARVDAELSATQRARWREFNLRFREEVERRMHGSRGPGRPLERPR